MSPLGHIVERCAKVCIISFSRLSRRRALGPSSEPRRQQGGQGGGRPLPAASAALAAGIVKSGFQTLLQCHTGGSHCARLAVQNAQALHLAEFGPVRSIAAPDGSLCRAAFAARFQADFRPYPQHLSWRFNAPADSAPLWRSNHCSFRSSSWSPCKIFSSPLNRNTRERGLQFYIWNSACPSDSRKGDHPFE